MPTATRAPGSPPPPPTLTPPPPRKPPALAALLLLIPPALLAAAPSALAESGGWSLAPSGDGRPAFYAEGGPGAVLEDTVAVTNRGRSPVTVRLRGTGVPVSLARAALTVPARTRAEVPFTVTVPRGAGPGDRTGALVARDAHGRTATVPVRLRVGGPALAALTVEHLAVHADRITYDLVNRGTTVLVPKLAVRADGVFGRVLDRAPRTLPVRLPPGARRTFSEPWPGRPLLGEARVRLTVTAGGGARDTASASAAYVPWGAVAGAAAATTVGAAVLLRGRRARPAQRAATTGAVS
ncbi:hypothetical protein KBP30_24305 [Streptomyces sp. Go40/10]|uniref:COG1470 family protein n=1 Tax=Streptomyces sp. Go40/10 TaxID=2825844 RepID=UPI001E5F2750|nr:hypothetical protein [Streptomyces sp. Go40/10]UFR04099.1 hypothetical protein KBP30_24305 [Streptomyces sp. Go40/10]